MVDGDVLKVGVNIHKFSLSLRQIIFKLLLSIIFIRKITIIKLKNRELKVTWKQQTHAGLYTCKPVNYVILIVNKLQ